MKKLIYISILLAAVVSSSCKKSLDEVPKDFFSPENSFTNKAQFEAALANIYLRVRTDMYAAGDAKENYDLMGIDADFADVAGGDVPIPMFNWNTLNADNAIGSKWWNRF